MNRKVVHVVPHFHWDREWYFTVEDSSVLLIEDMNYLVEMLEQNDKFKCFVLDGQMAVIDDLLQLNPQIEKRFRALVTAEKLIIGPLYSQCDTQVIKLESIIRNLEFGKQVYDKFDNHMSIGYLPDCFGQNAYLPSLFKEFELKYSIYQRGLLNEDLEDSHNFMWKSPDGKQILTNNIFNGYGLGKFLKADNAYLNEFLLPVLDNRKDEVLLVPAGGDQYPPEESLPLIIEKINTMQEKYTFILSSYEKFMDEVQTSKEITGELIECQKSRIHRTMHSSRMDIKIINTRVEKKIIEQLEPLYAMFAEMGGHINDTVYEDIWKKLLVIQGHDGICSCNSDATNEDVKARLCALERFVDAKINIIKKRIAINLDYNEDDLLLFSYNQNNQYNSEVTLFTKSPNFELLLNGKSIEYTIFNTRCVEGGSKVVLTKTGEKQVKLDDYYETTIIFNDLVLDFGCYHIEIVEKNKMEIHDYELSCKALSFGDNEIQFDNELVINGQVVNLEVSTDDGDSYDYAYVKDEKPKYFSRITNVAIKQYKTLAEITGDYEINNFLEQKMKVKIKVLVYKTDVKFELSFKNSLSDTRVRVALIHNLGEKKSYADCGFSLVKRDNYQDRAYELWNNNQMVEEPLSVYPFERGVQFGKWNLINSSVTEYQATDNIFYLTLFRSNEYLGKDNLTTRPGRASGINNVVVKTPKAQMIGVEFNIQFTLTTKELYESYYKHTANTDFYQLQQYNLIMNRVDRFVLKKSNEKLSLFTNKLFEGDAKISAITSKAGKTNLRLYNPSDKTVELKLNKQCNIINIIGSIIEVTDKVVMESKSYCTIEWKEGEYVR